MEAQEKEQERLRTAESFYRKCEARGIKLENGVLVGATESTLQQLADNYKLGIAELPEVFVKGMRAVEAERESAGFEPYHLWTIGS